jgi:hypothetical protein
MYIPRPRQKKLKKYSTAGQDMLHRQPNAGRKIKARKFPPALKISCKISCYDSMKRRIEGKGCVNQKKSQYTGTQ